MPVGAAQAAFGEAAASDGIRLEAAKVSWINQRGHFALPQAAADIAGPALETIFLALGDETATQLGKRVIALPGDFYHLRRGLSLKLTRCGTLQVPACELWSCIRQERPSVLM